MEYKHHMIFFFKDEIENWQQSVFMGNCYGPMDQAQHNLYHSRIFNIMGLSRPSHIVHHYQDHHPLLYPVNVETMVQLKESWTLSLLHWIGSSLTNTQSIYCLLVRWPLTTWVPNSPNCIILPTKTWGFKE